MDHYQFIFERIADREREILIALLSNIGFEGFEEDETWMKAFIPVDQFQQDLFDNIIQETSSKYYKSLIKEINWNQKWESEFDPVVVMNPVTNTPFAAVRANFHAPVKEVLYDLVITPKMSFGTGHHATTYLMIQQMCLLDFKGKKVIDFGTGTGVLAILAEKLGASKITGIDNDEWSINNARENIEANACKNIELIQADTILPDQRADIVLANINLNIIIANLAIIRAACNPGSVILFSGIMVQDQEQIISVLKSNKLFIFKYFMRDYWLIIVLNEK